jgi:hypothetical protein
MKNNIAKTSLFLMAAAGACFWAWADLEPCYTYSDPKPLYTSDDCGGTWTIDVNAGNPPVWTWAGSLCTYVTETRGSECKDAAYETGAKGDGTYTSPRQRNESDGVSEPTGGPPNLGCECVDFTATRSLSYNNVNDEWCKLTSQGCRQPFE